MKQSSSTATVAGVLTALYYFYQYALRTAPSVMMPQLSTAFALSSLGVASLVGVFYYAYSPFSLVAGTALDRLGAKAAIPAGALVAAIGALLFGTGNVVAAHLGRFLQGAGGVFALVGAVYIASNNFPANRAATLIGATQMFGMAGGSAGQFLVGPMIASGIPWQSFWIGMSMVGAILAGVLSDRLGRRRPVIIGGAAVLLACVAWVLFGQPGSIPPYVIGILMSLASGAAMIPYTVIKESHARELGGTATGVINFVIFTFSALLGPAFAWGMQTVSGGGQMGLEHYRTTFKPMLYGVALAIVLTFLLKETGPAAAATDGSTI